ncbi:copper/zinc superoxide dismutase [Onchocerca flexuosa]|uniref:Superoxide dismutase [Cu-Zn] n=1 Tax=Onchocerca flexuosa TaxID=387005 RepID=A0A238BQK0_9BILA|nr:copper/zinc superoxide dismutase [Onchocerca flexuosa]
MHDTAMFGGGMHDDGMRRAVAVLRGDTVSGIIYFQQDSRASPTTISGRIIGLTPGLHGFHIHQYGDQTRNCTSAAGHYNPFGKTHGAPSVGFIKFQKRKENTMKIAFDNNTEKHVGDLGNIEAGANGVADINIASNQIQLSGPLSIIGRSLVVHAKPDDLGQGMGSMRDESLKTGNAGARVACAIVGIAPVS